MRTLRMILISEDGNRSLERTIDVDWNVMLEMPMQLQDLQARMDALQDPAMGIVQNSPQENPEYAKSTPIGLVYHPDVVKILP